MSDLLDIKLNIEYKKLDEANRAVKGLTKSGRGLEKALAKLEEDSKKFNSAVRENAKALGQASRAKDKQSQALSSYKKAVQDNARQLGLLSKAVERESQLLMKEREAINASNAERRKALGTKRDSTKETQRSTQAITQETRALEQNAKAARKASAPERSLTGSAKPGTGSILNPAGFSEAIFDKFNGASKEAAANSDDLRLRFLALGNSIAVLDGPLGGVASRFSSFGVLTGRVGIAGAAAAVGITALTTAVTRGVREFAAFEESQLRLEALLQVNGKAAEISADRVEAFSQKLALSTLAGVDEVRAASTQILNFRSVTTSNFERILRSAQDLSSAGFGSLQQNARELAKAIEDPDRTLSSFARRTGLLSQEVQRDIREAVNMGESGRATETLLGAIEGRVKGISEAQVGVAAQFDAIGQASSLVFQKVGGFVIEDLGLGKPIEDLSNLSAAIIEADIAQKEFNASIRALPTAELEVIASGANLSFTEKLLKSASGDETTATIGPNLPLGFLDKVTESLREQRVALEELERRRNAVASGISQLDVLKATLDDFAIKSQDSINRAVEEGSIGPIQKALKEAETQVRRGLGDISKLAKDIANEQNISQEEARASIESGIVEATRALASGNVLAGLLTQSQRRKEALEAELEIVEQLRAGGEAGPLGQERRVTKAEGALQGAIDEGLDPQVINTLQEALDAERELLDVQKERRQLAKSNQALDQAEARIRAAQDEVAATEMFIKGQVKSVAEGIRVLEVKRQEAVISEEITRLQGELQGETDATVQSQIRSRIERLQAAQISAQEAQNQREIQKGVLEEANARQKLVTAAENSLEAVQKQNQELDRQISGTAFNRSQSEAIVALQEDYNALAAEINRNVENGVAVRQEDYKLLEQMRASLADFFSKSKEAASVDFTRTLDGYVEDLVLSLETERQMVALGTENQTVRAIIEETNRRIAEVIAEGADNAQQEADNIRAAGDEAINAALAVDEITASLREGVAEAAALAGAIASADAAAAANRRSLQVIQFETEQIKAGVDPQVARANGRRLGNRLEADARIESLTPKGLEGVDPGLQAAVMGDLVAAVREEQSTQDALISAEAARQAAISAARERARPAKAPRKASSGGRGSSKDPEEELNKILERRGSTLESLVDRLDPAGAAQRKYREELELLSISEKEYSQILTAQIKAQAEKEGVTLTEAELKSRVADATRDLASAQQKLSEEYRRSVDPVYDYLQGLDEASETQKIVLDGIKGFQSNLEEFFFDPAEKGLNGFIVGVSDTLRRSLSKSLSSQVTKFVFEGTGLGQYLSGLGGQDNGAMSLNTAGTSLNVAAQSLQVAAARLSGGAVPNVIPGASVGGGLGGILQGGISSLFAGLFDNGGDIPRGQFGVVGEMGPELVSGPARVTSRKDTEKMMAPREQNLKVINVLDPSIVGQYLKSEDGEKMILNVLSENGAL